MSGGAVEEFQAAFARTPGKEWQLLSPPARWRTTWRFIQRGEEPRLAQSESHIYCDSLDCVDTLSHLNMVPLAEGRATFTLKEVEEAVKRNRWPIPAPGRRDFHRMPRAEKAGRDIRFRGDEDNLRLCPRAGNQAPSTAPGSSSLRPIQKITPTSTRAFSTVYVSLYKYFGAATGAVPAGPKPVIQKSGARPKAVRRRSYHAWPYTAVACIPPTDSWTASAKQQHPPAFDHALGKGAGFRIEDVPHGTNICRIHVPTENLERLRSEPEKARHPGLSAA